jgi:hypothetical protein
MNRSWSVVTLLGAGALSFVTGYWVSHSLFDVEVSRLNINGMSLSTQDHLLHSLERGDFANAQRLYRNFIRANLVASGELWGPTSPELEALKTRRQKLIDTPLESNPDAMGRCKNEDQIQA